MSTPPPSGPGASSDPSASGRDETMPWLDPDRTEDTGADGPGKHRADEQPTTAMPVGDRHEDGGGATPAGYWQGQGPEARATEPRPDRTDEPAIFPEGVYEEPPSRAGAHLWSLLIALVLSPVAWFLINDGSARIYWSLRSDVSEVNLAGVAGLAVGLLAAMIVLLTARWSSVGVVVAGVVSLVVGLALLLVPNRGFDVLDRWEDPLRQFGGFGENLFAYLVEGALRGQFVIAGVVLVLVGVVSHGARRKGRREEYARMAVRAARGTNPFA